MDLSQSETKKTGIKSDPELKTIYIYKEASQCEKAQLKYIKTLGEDSVLKKNNAIDLGPNSGIKSKLNRNPSSRSHRGLDYGLESAAGFSLVELMVVVGIIAILASIAVPQFQKFAFRARTTEARAGLSSLYTAEKAFFGEWMEYDARFGAIGYTPEGRYYYNIGFDFGGAGGGGLVLGGNVSRAFQTSRGANDTAAPNGAPNYYQNTNINLSCNGGAGAQGGQNRTTGTCMTMPTVPDSIAGTNLTATTFKAQAAATAALNPDGTTHHIAIDQNRQFTEAFGQAAP